MALLKAALFDWDGTLFDSLRNTNFYNVVKKLGWTSDRKIEGSIEKPEYFGKSAQHIISDLFPGVTQEEIDLFHKVWNELDHENIGLLPGTLEILENLRLNEVKTGIISQRNGASLQKLVTKHNLRKFFSYDLIQGKDTWAYSKPDYRVFNWILYLLKEVGIKNPADKIIYIGDSLDDLYCTRQASIEFFGLETGPIQKERWIKEGLDADHIHEDLKSLNGWLVSRKYLN